MVIDEEIKGLYYRVIDVANFFVTNSSIITIESLKEHDPSVEEMAKAMRLMATVLKDLAGDSYDDTDMAMNAFQCCLIMEQIADVVADDNEDGLEDLVRQLEVHVNVP